MNTTEPRPPRVIVAGKELPLTLSTDEAAAWLHSSPERLQQKRGEGVLPVEPLTLGHRLRWPTAQLAEALGLPYEVVVDDATVTDDSPEAQVSSLSSGTHPGGEGAS